MKPTLTLITSLLLAPLASLHAAEPKIFDITAYNAKGDGTTLNTSAIQKAIDACHAAGGGTVLVPSGIFMSGSLRLKSRVTLRVEKDAILRGSPKIADYTDETAPLHWGGVWAFAASQWKQCLIYAEDAEQIGIEGPGTIDGQGGLERKVFPNANDPRRPMLVRLVGCRKVTVRDVKLLDPAAFTTFFVRSEDIVIEDVTIRSRHSPNGDGLDFDGCKRVRIKDCDIDAGDDGIAPKVFHPDWPNEDFEISGCHITSRWHAIRIGTESIAAIRRLTVRDCVFTQCQGGIKIESCEGALFEDLSFSGIEMKQVCQPFMLLASRFPFSAHGKSARPPVGRIRNVRFADIRVVAGVGDDVGFQSKSGKVDPFERLCSAVVSLPGTRIEDVSFTNIDLTFPGGGTSEQASRLDVGELLESSNYVNWALPFDGELPASALYLRHVKGIRLENVRLELEKPDARAFIAGDDVEGLTLRGVIARAPAPVPGLVKLADSRDVTEKDCRVECGANMPVMIAPTANEVRRLDELRKRSSELDGEIQQKADQADAAKKKTAGSPATFCNPLPIPNYPIGHAARTATKGSPDSGANWLLGHQEQFRELADPVVLWHDGKWYLYPSGDMAWVSEDQGATWQHHPINVREIGYPATVVRHRDRFLFANNSATLYASASPLGPFEKIGDLQLKPSGEVPPLMGKMLFSDDDGRLFLYFGVSEKAGIWGVELDAADPTKPLTEPVCFIDFNPQERPWEAHGEWNQNSNKGWLETAWMLKRNGQYYLTYSAAGTQYRTYAMGCFVGSSPLGPFQPQKHNPILRTTDGLVAGTASGSIVAGPENQLWAFYTIRAGVVHSFERRIGMERAEIDANGELVVNGSTSLPQWLPGKMPLDAKSANTGWLPINGLMHTLGSTSAPNLPGRLAVDNEMRTWWQPAEGDMQPTLTSNFGAPATIHAVRLIWRDIGLDTKNGVLAGPFRYRVELETAKDQWTTILDRSESTEDLLIDYRECKPATGTRARLVILGSSKGITPGVAEITVFGKTVISQ